MLLILTYMTPDVPSKIGLVSESTSTTIEVTFKRLFSSVDSHVAHKFVLFSEFFVTPERK